MDDQTLTRLIIGARAVGALQGLIRCGALNNHPRTAEMAKELCAEWEATVDASWNAETQTGSALPRPGAEVSP